ncbi:MAG: transposase [Spirochaetes bacterium]|nr:transposase [Spirochaetota bacterium]
MAYSGFEYKASSISNITKKVIEEVKAFKGTELEKDYYAIYIDCLFTNIRRDTVAKEAVYLVLGVNTEGYRDILGLYIYPQESASVLDDTFKDLKSRGLERVLLFVTDGLTGIEEVISKNFTYAKIQRCLLHITRNINKKCRVKDREELMKDFKKVY